MTWKKDFPLLQRKVNGKKLVYLNSAATSQKPQVVIDSLKRYYEEYNSNIHRGNDFMSLEATKQYDLVREKVANFIRADADEIIFTKGTTEGINLLMYSLGEELGEGDEIILTVMEHHSNLVPWQFLQHKGVKLRYVDIDDEGKLRMDQFHEMLSSQTKLVCVTYVSNVLGIANPVQEISAAAHRVGAWVIVDAAQAVPHFPVDVKTLDCDFLVFSGHKMLGPMGIGVLYGKKEWLQNMQPFLYGGDMIKEVGLEKSSWAELPRKFEAGTPNVEGIIGLGVAVDYLQEIGMDAVVNHEKELMKHAIEKLSKVNGMKIYGLLSSQDRIGVISFNLGDVHAHDVSEFLGSKGIAVRAGHMCCQPLMKGLGISSCVRASFCLYNTLEDVDALCTALQDCGRFFGI